MPANWESWSPLLFYSNECETNHCENKQLKYSCVFGRKKLTSLLIFDQALWQHEVISVQSSGKNPDLTLLLVPDIGKHGWHFPVRCLHFVRPALLWRFYSCLFRFVVRRETGTFFFLLLLWGWGVGGSRFWRLSRSFLLYSQSRAGKMKEADSPFYFLLYCQQSRGSGHSFLNSGVCLTAYWHLPCCGVASWA